MENIETLRISVHQWHDETFEMHFYNEYYTFSRIYGWRHVPKSTGETWARNDSRLDVAVLHHGFGKPDLNKHGLLGRVHS